jgi:hypothetical protein
MYSIVSVAWSQPLVHIKAPPCSTPSHQVFPSYSVDLAKKARTTKASASHRDSSSLPTILVTLAPFTVELLDQGRGFFVPYAHHYTPSSLEDHLDLKCFGSRILCICYVHVCITQTIDKNAKNESHEESISFHSDQHPAESFFLTR